ncbi:MAG: multidrug effflux MFS transporter [Rhodovibrionaceae bacterium]
MLDEHGEVLAPTSSESEPERHAPLGFRQFVGIVGALMALNALAIGILLPSLPDIADAFDLEDPNRAQTVITAYLIGFGFGQLMMGVLSDRYGRRPILLAGIFVYGCAAMVCAFAPDMTTLLVARFAQGVGSAAPRVIALAAVRDCYGGRRMARIISLAVIIFMVVPVVAPSIGQLVLLAASWQALFGFLVFAAFAIFLVCFRFLPETLPRQSRRAIRLDLISEALRSMLGSRQTIGYMLSAGVFFGAFFGFVNSAQQVLGETLGMGRWFPLVFAATASSIAISSFVNSRLVERLGMRTLGHWATLIFLAIALAMLLLAILGQLTAFVFLPLLTTSMLLVGIVFANFNALAMEPQQKVAGFASSVVGAVTILLGAGGGYLIGQAYDGTLFPLVIGFVLSGAGTTVLLLMTERGKLF